ncbi:membrane-associated zinc metalloprotease [Thermodesulfatator indicus DSM 15286]|uniref:Zinc metalloprotease n=1 Tax=Thermodesulfatator indicus (strain DSM 15286 / JCM 11887 / CIR29812) TaxID=667014 RepID=F8ADC1_THEID|nr:RIP metalloprotease RseP [Thermodesulfatator indicus]AEH45936.1 membrane-associated zinc metalloprotease [Thermodesulfatator indicus DSM 15286]
MHTAIAVIIVLGVLIFFHEFGHFLMARMLGVRVLVFSLGFGPKIFAWVRNGTEYRLSAIPLGGYVKLLGESPADELSPEEIKYSFSHKPLKDRALIVLAGPIANFVLAWIFFVLVFTFQGKPVYIPEVGQVLPNSPAAQAGLKPGDLIVAIDGKPIKTWEELSEIIKIATAKPLKLTIKRGEQEITLVVKPEIREAKNLFGETIRTPMIGIVSAGKAIYQKVAPHKALVEGLLMVVALIKLTLISILKLIERVLPLSTLGGPIFIAQLAGEQAQAGVWALMSFMAILSVNLGVLNLLPIPMLDGGHLFMYAIEAVIRRPIPDKVKELAMRVGLALLLLLMAVVFYNDIMRILGRNG